jgi:hypothetical protein
MPRYKLRLQRSGEPERSADFDAGERSYEVGDVIDLREPDGLWRVQSLEPLSEPFLAELVCIPYDEAVG